MSRYFSYHWGGGWGIEYAKPSIETTVGSAVHDLLSQRLVYPGNGPEQAEGLWRDRLRIVGDKRQETPHTIAEQQHMALSLARGWWTIWEPWLQENWEVVESEREYTLPLADGRISLMSRPDLVMRNKATRKLALLDFKTMANYDEKTTPAQFRDSVQMALMTAVVEETHQEPVDSFWIAGLVKGSRKFFEKDGEKSPEKRHYSHLCYASEPKAPFGKEWSTKGYWLHKKPVWEHFTPQEWVEHLQAKEPGTLAEMFPMMGPFERQTHMIPQALRGISGQEERWITTLEHLDREGYSEESVDTHVPRSYGHCTSYFGDECPFYRLCYKLPGWDDPIGSGFYRPRRPHHVPEQEQLVSTGTPLPLEPWE